MNRKVCFAAAIVAVALVAWSGAAFAADEEGNKDDNRWLNDTELSLVATQGNSEIFTLGFKNLYQKWWGPEAKAKKNLFSIKAEAVSSDKADPREVDADIEFPLPPGTIDPCLVQPQNCFTVDQPLEDNIERYLLEARYDQKFTNKMFWYVLGSWDRNLTDGSGILSRYIGTAGIGNVWWDNDDIKFRTNYGLSYTDREETDPDPLKEDEFAGLRFDWAYSNKWGKNVTYRNTWTINYSLEDSEDYNFDMVNAIIVSMTDRVSLSVSVQWLYNNFPPLEDVDLNCVIPDPDDPRGSIPCDLVCIDLAGDLDIDCDTLDSGGTRLTDETSIRKNKTDILFNTSLIIKL